MVAHTSSACHDHQNGHWRLHSHSHCSQTLQWRKSTLIADSCTCTCTKNNIIVVVIYWVFIIHVYMQKNVVSILYCTSGPGLLQLGLTERAHWVSWGEDRGNWPNTAGTIQFRGGDAGMPQWWAWVSKWPGRHRVFPERLGSEANIDQLYLRWNNVDWLYSLCLCGGGDWINCQSCWSKIICAVRQTRPRDQGHTAPSNRGCSRLSQ